MQGFYRTLGKHLVFEHVLRQVFCCVCSALLPWRCVFSQCFRDMFPVQRVFESFRDAGFILVPISQIEFYMIFSWRF